MSSQVSSDGRIEDFDGQWIWNSPHVSFIRLRFTVVAFGSKSSLDLVAMIDTCHLVQLTAGMASRAGRVFVPVRRRTDGKNRRSEVDCNIQRSGFARVWSQIVFCCLLYFRVRVRVRASKLVLPSVCLSSSSSSFGAAEQGAGGKEVRTWCGKRRRRPGEKEVSKQWEVAMRLITHNMLSCNIKGVTNGYPLGIEASRLETKESELNPEFLRKIFPKLEWKALRDAAHSVCVYAGFFSSFFALSARLHRCCWAIRSFGKRFLHMRISSRNPKFYPMPCSFPFAEGLLDREPFWQVEFFWVSQVRVVCEQKEWNICGRNYCRGSRMESSFASFLKFSCLRGLQLGLNDLPEHVEPSMLEDEDFLKNFHHALLEVSLPILLFLVATLACQQMSFDRYNIVQFLT